MTEITELIPAKERFLIKNDNLNYLESDSLEEGLPENALVKKIKKKYRQNKKYGKFLIENGYIAKGFDEPQGELRKLIDDGFVTTETGKCFESCQRAIGSNPFAITDPDIFYLEGWYAFPNSSTRHAFIYDRKREKLYDPTLFQREPDDAEAYESKKYHTYYFGIKIPRKEMSHSKKRIYELEDYAEKKIGEDVSHQEVLPESKQAGN